MSEPYIGEIRLFAGRRAPRYWAFCHGQLLQIKGNDSLFSLLGKRFGGDGRTNFALPDFRGRVPVHKGQGQGLTNRALGERGGAEAVTLTARDLPDHTHGMQFAVSDGQGVSPENSLPGKLNSGRRYNTDQDAPEAVLMSTHMLQQAGGDTAHENRMPSCCISFIIALQGVYPSRN